MKTDDDYTRTPDRIRLVRVDDAPDPPYWQLDGVDSSTYGPPPKGSRFRAVEYTEECAGFPTFAEALAAAPAFWAEVIDPVSS
jgi:hypothetical protein